MSTPITDHFTVEEFACHDGQVYPVDNAEDGSGVPTDWDLSKITESTWRWTRLQPLCETLEVIREAAGGDPMTVDSGFRDEEYDEKLYNAHVAAAGDDGLVAPASRSIHPKGGAADMKHSKLSPIALFSLALKLYEEGKLPYLGGIGLYPTFVHFDVRPRSNGGQHLAIWGGHRPSNIA